MPQGLPPSIYESRDLRSRDRVQFHTFYFPNWYSGAFITCICQIAAPPRMTMGSCGFNGILRVIPEMKTFHVLTSQRDLQHRNGRGREGGSNTSCIPPPSDLTRGGMSGCVSCQPGSSWVLQMPHRVASKSLSSQTQNSMGGRRQTLGRSNCKNSWEIGQTPTWNGNTRVCPCLLERCCFIISRHCLEEGT